MQRPGDPISKKMAPEIIDKQGVVTWLFPTTSCKYLINKLGMKKKTVS
jgi:hypothetical protein